MKYYEMHEQVYKSLKASGFISWDKQTDLEKLWMHQINQFLKLFLEQQSINLSTLETLDLGTGSGTCALFCAREGAKSIGVDISKTAIEMARANNAALNLHVEFMEADILNLKLNKKFDLITDSSLLHCLVGDEDRQKFYQVVRSHLKKSGFIFIHTMIKSENMNGLFSNEYFHMKGDVLYSLGISEIESGRVDFQGKSYFPHRTILSRDALLAEFVAADFELVQSNVLSSAGEPDNFIGLLKFK